MEFLGYLLYSCTYSYILDVTCDLLDRKVDIELKLSSGML